MFVVIDPLEGKHGNGCPLLLPAMTAINAGDCLHSSMISLFFVNS